MGKQKIQRGFAQLAVNGDCAVVADGPVNERNARGKYEHHQNEVAANEARDNAKARDHFSR